jgi:protein involved in polysaccharide export with SLBB domain
MLFFVVDLRSMRAFRSGLFRLFLLAVLAFPFPAAAQDAVPSPASDLPVVRASSMEQLDNQRAITLGDRLVFITQEDRDPAGFLTVNERGDVDVPYIGAVPAQGKTCKQLALDIKKIYLAKYYNKATVLITLDASKPRGKVYVMGQVKSQGGLDIPQDEVFTVSKAILRSGGFADFADKRKVKLIRQGPNGVAEKPVEVDVLSIIQDGKTKNDIVLRPDDMIIVPQRLINF